jgi:hypothetical protein
MRLFGRRRRPLSESPSCHDSTLACSVASITELFRLESGGPSHKAVGTAIRQRDIHLSDLSKKVRHLKMVSISKFTRKLANHKNVSANFA